MTKTTEEPSTANWIRILKQSGVQETGRFAFLRFRRAEINTARVAIIVSRKIGKAVVRNKIRRRLREISKICMNDAVAPGYYLLIARNAIANTDFAHLKADIMGLFEKLSRDMKSSEKCSLC